jgi:membrane associated rhomboid family serine protease
MSITRDIRIALKGTYGALFRLIVINVVIFIALNIIVSVLQLYGYGPKEAELMVADYTDLPAPLQVLLIRFWTLFTYMFVHFGFMHILSNMLWLYFLGKVFSDLMGGARMIGTYIIGGLCGGLLFIAFSNFVPGQLNTELEGASAGVMAIVIAAAAYSPDFMMYPFGFPMKLKWLALISFLLTSVVNLTDDTGGKIAHIGGAIFGIIYGTQMRTGAKFMEGFMNLFRFKSFKKNGPLRVEHTRSARGNDEIYNQNKVAVRKRVDEILDKISRSGYDSLTKEEKTFLQKNHDKF